MDSADRHASKPAYDPIIQGWAGVMSAQTTQGTAARRSKNILADKVTSMTAALAIVAALYEASVSGQGQHSELAMIDAAAVLPDGRHGDPAYVAAARRVASAQSLFGRAVSTADGYMTIAPLTDKHWTHC